MIIHKGWTKKDSMCSDRGKDSNQDDCKQDWNNHLGQKECSKVNVHDQQRKSTQIEHWSKLKEVVNWIEEKEINKWAKLSDFVNLSKAEEPTEEKKVGKKLNFDQVFSDSDSNNLFENLSKNWKFNIKELLDSNTDNSSQATEILESWKVFQSMLFATPPKVDDFKSPSPSPSPLIDIMQSLNDILPNEEEKHKLLLPELIKLLDSTHQHHESKQFVPKKCSRNISSMFSENKPPKVSISQKYSQGKSSELSSNGTQPFYPQNYNWAKRVPQNVEKGKIESKTAYPVNVAGNNLYHQPACSGSVGQAQPVRAPPQKFKTMQEPNCAHLKKNKWENKAVRNKDFKKIPKRAVSNNSNTSNKENFYQATSQEQAKEEQSNSNFSFPDGGWVWSFCQNYNFFGRVRCNRWSKVKSKEDCEGKPQHIIRKEIKSRKKNDENNMNNMNKMNKYKMKKQAVKIEPVEVPPSDSDISEGNKKNQSERVGDWVCFSCNNLNFSFRKIWNRCKITREESEMQYMSFQPSAIPNEQMMGFPFSSVNAPTHYPNVMNPLQSYPNNNCL